MGREVKLKTEDYLELHDITCQWVNILGLQGWSIVYEKIDPNSVLYDDDISEEDRYYIGVESCRIGCDKKIATIYHDRDITEKDIIHELLHVRYPDWTEEHVNQVEQLLYSMKYEVNKQKRR